jgi:hypothetical protein
MFECEVEMWAIETIATIKDAACLRFRFCSRRHFDMRLFLKILNFWAVDKQDFLFACFERATAMKECKNPLARFSSNHPLTIDVLNANVGNRAMLVENTAIQALFSRWVEKSVDGVESTSATDEDDLGSGIIGRNSSSVLSSLQKQREKNQRNQFQKKCQGEEDGARK